MLRFMTTFHGCLIFGILALGSTLPIRAASQVPTPPAHLTIGIYNYAGASEATLKDAIQKAEHVLNGVAVDFTWVHCMSQTCGPTLPERPDFLIVRIVAQALTPGDALGMTSISARGATASVFYDRALGMRSHGVTLPEILGIAIAHELVHVLLPNEPHAPVGLMKPRWRAYDLRIGSAVWAGVSKRTAELMYDEAERRSSWDVAAVTVGILLSLKRP